MNYKAKPIEKKRLTVIKAAEAALILGAAVLLACFFDYRYAMNDDVFVNAIISGKYSGTPDIHNVSIGTPLNAVFCLLYRVNGAVPWFGGAMIVCQFYSLYSVMTLLCRKMSLNKVYAGIFWLSVNVLLTGIMANELIIVQYTYTAALLMASATIRLYSMEGDFFSKRGILVFGSILLQFLFTYCLRTEIFLFLLPFSILFSLIHYYRANGLRINKGEIKKWCFVWGSLICGAAVLYMINAASYGNEGWKEYKRVDAYRTQLYDFLELPSYAENQEFYESAGITEVQYELLKNYNFSLDDGITSETLKSIVDYANEKRISGYQGLEKLYYRMFTLPLKEGLWSYSHRVLFDSRVAGDDYPWNFVCAALYLVLLLLTCFSKRVQNIVWLVLMVSMRSVLWLYIILKQRTPPRVTHSLFVIEIVCLLVLIFEEISFLKESGRLKKPDWLYIGLSVLFLAGAGTVAASGWESLRSVYEATVAYNEEWEELLSYCREHDDSFYFMDVYSTVNYSEAIFSTRNSRMDNYDICGGWLAKSPLCEEKYRQFGISSVQTALVENDNVFFVTEQGSGLEWLSGLYAQRGILIEFELQDNVAGQFDVYRLMTQADR